MSHETHHDAGVRELIARAEARGAERVAEAVEEFREWLIMREGQRAHDFKVACERQGNTAYYVGAEDAFGEAERYLRALLAERPAFEQVAQMEAEIAAKAQVWDEAAEATADWMSNNPSPSGVPHDPPRNPYRAEDGTR